MRFVATLLFISGFCFANTPPPPAGANKHLSNLVMPSINANLGSFSAGTIDATLSGNASTATALAANPTDCSSNTFATAIDASGNLSCAAVADAALSGSYILADGSRGLSADWNAGSHNITGSTFIGALQGQAETAVNSTNSINTGVTDDTTTNAAYYLTWVTGAGANYPQKVSTSKLTFNPSTGNVTSTTFTGALAGNATTATSATTATTATNSTNGAITDDTTTNATMYPVWVTTTAGNLPHKVSSSKMTFNPSTGTVAATTFSGALSGNATTATALAANPSDCASDTYATTIAASGNLTCASITNASTTAVSTNTNSTIVLRDSSGDFSAHAITATSFNGRVNPTQFVETVVAGGTCSTTYTVDPTTGTMFNVTLSGACSFAVTNLAAGHSFTIKITQSSTTLPTFTSAYKWATATTPTFSNSATKYDMVACVSLDGTTLDCSAIIDVR